MKLTLKYFASMKEHMACSTEAYEASETVKTVGALKQDLLINHSKFASACAEVGRVQVAVNQEMADDDAALQNGAEVAFFPPVTGG
ncbi:MAG: molybdopterin converting factor subunit 1 [Limnobacter sp.]|nr:molybdopterin converting factor subunit 1 [Limnobacter sp.]